MIRVSVSSIRLLSLLFLLLFSRPSALLHTGESCRTTLECEPPRRCYDTALFQPCLASGACVCIPPEINLCNSTEDDCPENETCARREDTTFSCVSNVIISAKGSPSRSIEQVKKTPLIPICPSGPRPLMPSIPGRPNGMPAPNGLPAPKPNGLNAELCQVGTCAPGLSCVTLVSIGNSQFTLSCAEGFMFGACHPTDARGSCKSEDDCNQREACASTAVTGRMCRPVAELNRLPRAGKKTVIIFKKKGVRSRFLGGGRQPNPTFTPTVSFGASPSASITPVIGGAGGMDSPKPTPMDGVAPPSPSPTRVGTTTPTPMSSKATKTPAGTPSKVVPVQQSQTAVPTQAASVTVTGTATATVTATASATGSPSSSEQAEESVEAQEGVCVSVEHLKGMDRRLLVFKQDRWSKVVCDKWESCGTHGHMVFYQGEGMMMRSYCKIVGCVERVMRVNSPRYSRALRVDSKSDGLMFSSFAARWTTRVEEHLLRHMMRIGL